MALGLEGMQHTYTQAGHSSRPLDCQTRAYYVCLVGAPTDPVPLQAFCTLQVLEAELAEVDDRLLREGHRVRGEVPGTDPVQPQLHHLHIFHAGHNVVTVVREGTAGVTHAARLGGGGVGHTRRGWTGCLAVRFICLYT